MSVFVCSYIFYVASTVVLTVFCFFSCYIITVMVSTEENEMLDISLRYADDVVDGIDEVQEMNIAFSRSTFTTNE